MALPQGYTKQQLVEFSGEHLYYEIKMLYGLYETLRHEEKNVFIYNAMIEAFVIHSNILLEFFYKPQLKADDAKAVHYIKDYKLWKEKLPPYERYFKRFNRKRNRELVHLSYQRLNMSDEDKIIKPTKSTPQLMKIINLFLELADPELLDKKMYELKVETNE